MASWLPEFLSIHLKGLAFVQAWHLISRNGTVGDYIEFGVFQGETFKLALRTARNSYKTSAVGKFPGKFIACDSFQGLPEVESMNQKDNVFKAGQYTYPRRKFEKNIKSSAKGHDVVILDGWFHETLTEQAMKEHKISKVAIANVDCDIYESTVPCLEFLTPLLQTGTIIMFDDFYLMNGSMKAGEALAADEWLKKNPHIRLVPLMKYGIGGRMFIVNISTENSPFYLQN
jgi:hypothetical protein